MNSISKISFIQRHKFTINQTCELSNFAFSKTNHTETTVTICNFQSTSISSSETACFNSIIEDIKINSEIVENILENIITLNNSNKLDEAIKETYNIFFKLIHNRNLKTIDSILANHQTLDLPETLKISILNCTKPFKETLKNREKIFIHLKEEICESMGEENFSNSLYANLK